MVHEQLFAQAAEAFQQVDELLRQELFITSCDAVLRGPGVPFRASEPGKAEIPYQGSGIYLLWADLSRWSADGELASDVLISQFLDRWDDPEEDVSNFPRSNRGRAAKSLERYDRENWIPFYLGTARNVAHRVQQHLYLGPDKSTYALKLKARAKLLRHVAFKINWVPFATTNRTYILLGRVESLLRDHFMPIVGRQ